MILCRQRILIPIRPRIRDRTRIRTGTGQKITMRTRRTHNSSTKLCWLRRGRDYPFKASIYGSRRTQPRGRIGAQRGGRIASDTIFHECSKTKTSSQKFCSMAGWMLTCHAGVRSRPRRAHRRKEACQVLAPDRRGRHQQHPIYNALPETDELQEVGGVGFAAPQRQRSGAMGGGRRRGSLRL